MFLNNFKLEPKIHLRYIIQIAISIEEQGVEYYSKLAEKFSDINTKKLCSKLAGDEAVHKKLFQKTLLQWTHLPANNQILNSITQQLKDTGLFWNPPPLDASEKDLIKYAIEQEIKTADFYLSFEKNFPQTWKRLHVQQLVMTERAHANSLTSLLASLK